MADQIKKEIRKLRKKRNDFIKKSLSKFQIERKVGHEFSKEIIDNVKLSEEYDKKRYLLTDIKRYLDKLKDSEVFIELVGGQSSFLPPIGKHNQGKLFIKK